MLHVPIAPPIAVDDEPEPRRITSLDEARALVDDVLARRRNATWREMHNRLEYAETETEAAGAIGDLRNLLALEGLLASPRRAA